MMKKVENDAASVSFHKGDADKLVNSSRKGSLKVTVMPSHKTLTHLPKRPPVDLAFTNLSYSVKEGRKNSEYTFYFTTISSFITKNCQSSLITTESLNFHKRGSININTCSRVRVPRFFHSVLTPPCSSMNDLYL